MAGKPLQVAGSQAGALSPWIMGAAVPFALPRAGHHRVQLASGRSVEQAKREGEMWQELKAVKCQPSHLV